MTTEEQTEWNYLYEERLGILCGSLSPTPEQKKIASDEAYDHLCEGSRLEKQRELTRKQGA